MYFRKSFYLTIIILFLFDNPLYAIVERPRPVVPSPEDIYWKKIKPFPYTMVIKSEKYGDFNFTQSADKALEEYKMLCKATKYSMEIPAVALVNKKREVVDLICPPGDKILLLNINIDMIYENNKENTSLIEEMEKTHLNPDQRDDIIQRIIANAIYHPLGQFCFVEKDNRLMILAGVLNQSVYLPIECIDNPLNRVIQRNILNKHFPGDEADNITNERIVDLIYKKSKSASGERIILEDFPLRKDWYVVTTPNTCFWTDYFINYIEIESKKMDIESKIPIHLHPWVQVQWLLNTKEKYWISEYEIHLLPSGRDIEFFKSRYPDSRFYIIVGKDLYSEELTWAVYQDISLIEKEMGKLELNKQDYKQLKIVLKNIKDTRGVVQKYYVREGKPSPSTQGLGKGLIVDKEIDSLLVLNKRQMLILSQIDKYKKEYPWRLLNISFFLPLLNEQLEKKGKTPALHAGPGWKIVSNNKEILGYNASNREFYYKEGITPRMELCLFILFKLCYFEEDDLTKGSDREALTIGLLKGICSQLDYLCIKYYHLEEFARHAEYLSDIIRLNIWNREKESLIAKEQINNGRYYLDRYNLGYFKDATQDQLRLISNLSYSQGIRMVEIEGIVKDLSKRQKVKNMEEFIMEFEKQLILIIFTTKAQRHKGTKLYYSFFFVPSCLRASRFFLTKIKGLVL